MAPDSGGFGTITSRIGDALVRLFVQAVDARLLLDEDGIVVLANSRCEELLGWSVDDLVGSPAARVAPPEHHDSYRNLREVMLGSDPGDVTHLDLTALHRDGSEVRLRVTVRVIGLDGSARMLWLVLQPRVETETGWQILELLDIVADGNVVVDGGGRILMANLPAQAMFGYTEDELVDQPLELLVPEAQRTTHVRRRTGFTGHARRHAMGLGTRVAARRKDGTTFPVSVVISSIGADDDVLFSAIVHDLSEIEALRGSADAMRAQFLATMSHELRTPLTTILASTEMLEDDLADPDDEAARAIVAPYLERIERAARRELALVDDLLSLSIIEGEAERLGQGLTDLGHVAETIVSEFRALASAQGVSIAAVSTGRPVVVRAHEGWLERAVRCLVDNAVKFTPAGGRVEVVSGADPDQAWLEVRDTGPGNVPEEQERVFARLHRGRDAIAAETAGAGLGLTIARSIVRATGGSLEVVPDDAGARLRISAPHARI